MFYSGSKTMASDDFSVATILFAQQECFTKELQQNSAKNVASRSFLILFQNAGMKIALKKPSL
jgi:hypothetical protein